MLHSVFCRKRPVGGDRVRGRERCARTRGTASLVSLEGDQHTETPLPTAIGMVRRHSRSSEGVWGGGPSRD